MSYSRWGASCWYAYHSTASGKTLASQVLRLWHVQDDGVNWTYQELAHINRRKIRTRHPAASDQDAIEALAIIRDFRANMRFSFHRDGRRK